MTGPASSSDLVSLIGDGADNEPRATIGSPAFVRFRPELKDHYRAACNRSTEPTPARSSALSSPQGFLLVKGIKELRFIKNLLLLVILTLVLGSPIELAFRRELTASEAPQRQTENLRIAENLLLYQRDSGGWPKNYDRKEKLTEKQRQQIIADKSKQDSMIDNGATHTEVRLLARAYNATKDERFREAALRGIRYLLEAQYDNGGWPQAYPKAKGYARYITFNDNAMIGVMSLLRDIAGDRTEFSFVPADVVQQCAQAVERGIACILKCQITVDGQRTVWCAQHDEMTLKPQQARSYELASLSGSESVGIVRFLMQIQRPSDEAIEAIESAITWFERSKLTGIRMVRVEDKSQPGGFDRVVVQDPDAPPLWARFYDIHTNRPIYCSRDGVPRASIAEISHERRNGYSWMGDYARKLLEKDLPAWKERLGR